MSSAPPQPYQATALLMYRTHRQTRAIHKKREGDQSSKRKQMFAAAAHPQTRISIHRCYKLCRAGPWRGASRGGSGRGGAGLCTMLHTNFREILLQAFG